MSIEKTVLAFKEHLSSLLEQPVLIGWPESDEKGVYLYLYSVSESESFRQAIKWGQNTIVSNIRRYCALTSLIFGINCN